MGRPSSLSLGCVSVGELEVWSNFKLLRGRGVEALRCLLWGQQWVPEGAHWTDWATLKPLRAGVGCLESEAIGFLAFSPPGLTSGRQPQRGRESTRVFLRGAPLSAHGAWCVLEAWTPGRPAWLCEGRGNGLWFCVCGELCPGAGHGKPGTMCIVWWSPGVEMVSPGSLFSRACPHTHRPGVRVCSCPPVRFP